MGKPNFEAVPRSRFLDPSWFETPAAPAMTVSQSASSRISQRSLKAAARLLRVTLADRPRAAITGYVDHIGGGLIRGWAWDALAPTTRVTLDVFCGGVYLGCARTGGFRQDLFNQGFGDGCCGFIFHLPLWFEDDVCGDDFEIVATGPVPARLILPGGGPTSAPSNLNSRISMSAMFLPLVQRINQLDEPIGSTVAVEARPRVDPLCEPSASGATSAFAHHIALKYARPSPSTDLQSFWRWYMSHYAIEKGPARAPLSAADIETLNGLSSVYGTSKNADSYAWAVHESRRLYVEDCLVGTATERHLASVSPIWRYASFPVSSFMRTFKGRHRALRGLSVAQRRDRIRLYAAFMLFALNDVHYLRYMPKRWLDAMLETNADGILFEKAQQEVFGSIASFVSKETFLHHVAVQGFDVETPRFAGTSYHCHRIAGGDKILDGPPVDVQLIGPFRQSLGLAESCRRIAVALKGATKSVTFADYAVGRTSTGVADLAIGPLRPARINILHLNAEEVPEAMAYLPDTFSRSHTILIPYWELNRPAAVHKLGLELVDEIWATSRFLTDVFAGTKPVTHIGMSYDHRFDVSLAAGRALLARLGFARDRFTVVTTSDALSWTQRKNVLGAIEAFQAAFFGQRDVQLVVKTRNVLGPLSQAQAANWATIVSSCADDPRIKIVDAQLSDLEQKELIAGADCLLSLHRAEGLGLDILDALCLGTPVVATAYSGNMDVCSAETCWLVDFDLRPVDPADYAFVERGHVWAEPRLASAIGALRDVQDDATKRESRIAAAKARVGDLASPQALTDRLARLIEARLHQV